MLGMVLLDMLQIFADGNKRKQYHKESINNSFQRYLEEYF